MLGNTFLDVLDGNDRAPLLVQHVLEQTLDGVGSHRLAGEGLVGGHANQRALKAADVGADALGQETHHFIGQINTEGDSLVSQDGQSRLEIRRLHVGDQTPLEPGNQAVLEVLDFIGRPVAGHHDLLVSLLQGVERVEEFLLDAFLAGEKLDIINQEDIGVAVGASELGQVVVLNRLNVLVGKFLRRKIGDLQLWVFHQDIVADGVQQMCFAQPHSAVKEQWIVRAPRRLGHGQGCGVRKVVVVADHEGGKGVFRVERSISSR